MRCLAAALVMVAACGSDDAAPVDAPSADVGPPRETIMQLQPLAATDIVEGIMHGGTGDYAVIHLEAPSSGLDWNLHGHAGGGTQVIHEELGVMTVDFFFTPTATADWYLLLRNAGATNMDVKVSVGLYGDMTWRWQ